MRDDLLLAKLTDDEASAELARRRISDFIGYTKDDWLPARHHQLLCDLCDDVLYGRRRRVMISLPPRHSKSEIFSIRFPALYLGRYPQHSIIHVSYSAHLSNEFSRQVRALVRDDLRYRRLFPLTQLHPDRQRVDDWRTTAGGGMKSVGVGGGLTGHGANLLILDDIVKEGDEQNPDILRGHFEWYASAARTRLAPNGAIVVVMTRWHTRDLIGELRALERRDPDADKWEVIELPALAREGDPLGRDLGEPLWSERFDITALRGIEALSPRYFQSLYQQQPLDELGKLFDRADFQRFSVAPDGAGAWCFDLALSEKEAADFSTAARFVYDRVQGCLYVDRLHRWHDTYPVVKERIIEIARASDPRDVFVFPKHILELAAVADLKRSAPDLSWRLRQVKMSGDKHERAALFADRVRARKVFVLDNHEGDAFINECDQFPAQHDDYVDIGAIAAHYFGFREELRIIAGYTEQEWRERERAASYEQSDHIEQVMRRVGG